jgi:hypothetical protein
MRRSLFQTAGMAGERVKPHAWISSALGGVCLGHGVSHGDPFMLWAGAVSVVGTCMLNVILRDR